MSDEDYALFFSASFRERMPWRYRLRPPIVVTKPSTAQPAAEIETDGTARLLQTRHTDGLYVTTQLRFSLRSGVRE